jgi:thioredoxin reductase (NADPH)
VFGQDTEFLTIQSSGKNKFNSFKNINMSTSTENVKCLIIGSGPAGYTAAIYAARADLKPVLYAGKEPGGQLMITTDVENYPGFPNGMNGPAMMEEFRKQAARFETDIRWGEIVKVDFTGPVHKAWDDTGKEIHCNTVIIATGASAKWLGLESEKRLRDIGGGVSACAVCDGFFFKGQTVAIVGGGDSACEEASYLAKLCPKVYMLVRKDEMRASKAMIHRVENLKNIELLYNTEPLEVIGTEKVEGLKIFNNKTKEEKILDITGFFVAIGHKPNTDLFTNWLQLDEVGYIKNIPGTSKTNIEGVFVSGDAADKVYRQAVTAAGTGCMAALDAERYLAANGLH